MQKYSKKEFYLLGKTCVPCHTYCNGCTGNSNVDCKAC